MGEALLIGEHFAADSLGGFEAIMQAPTAELAMRQIERAAQALGFERLLFALIAPGPAGNRDICLHSSYPAAWRATYEKNNLRASDPTVAHCFSKLAPLVWQPDSFRTKAAQDMQEEAASFGLHTGVTLPLRGLNGEIGMLTCAADAASGRDFLRQRQSVLGQLTLLRDVAFDAMIQHLEPAAPEPVPSLTARELDCLKWVAAGKTTWEISRILNISEAGVNFHICNLRNKFGVGRRNDVVLKALRLGLISLP